MKDPLLLTPGPTNVPKKVLDATALPMIHHRTKLFQAVLERVNANLQKVFLTKQPVMTFASSGTGAMEGTITNLLSKGDKVLSFSAGKWGERYRDIAKAYGLNVISTEGPYGEAFKPEQVREVLNANPDAKAVLTTLCETSTAVTHPVKQFAEITRQSGAMLFVDAISGLACDELRMDEWGIDAVVCGSQKGFMLPPGLANVALSERAEKAIKTSNLPKYYFDFAGTLKAQAKNDTAYTPAVSLIRGMDVAMQMLVDEGMENVWKRHLQVAEYVRREMAAMGLQLFSKAPAAGLTAVMMPGSIPSGDVIKTMRELEEVWMADGQGELQGKLVRFAHMGAACTMKDAQTGMRVFTEAMAKSGHKTTAGAAR